MTSLPGRTIEVIGHPQAPMEIHASAPLQAAVRPTEAPMVQELSTTQVDMHGPPTGLAGRDELDIPGQPATEAAQTAEPQEAVLPVESSEEKRPPTKVTFVIDENQFHTLQPVVILAEKAVILANRGLEEGAVLFEPKVGTKFEMIIDGESYFVGHFGIMFKFGEWQLTVMPIVPSEEA